MTEEMNGLIHLTKDQIKPAAMTLAKAFTNYPVSEFILPNLVERRKKHPRIFASYLHNGLKYGEVYTTSVNYEGVAIWFGPDTRRESFWDRLRWRFFAPFVEDDLVLSRQRILESYATAVRARYAPSRHWYLQVLGVDPACQGQGYAGKLLKPMLDRADRDGLPCFLETQLEKNVTLYEHFGFRVVEAGIIPGSNLKSWAMVRNPS
jgi:GNAT superfamily N-acetyltransferase